MSKNKKKVEKTSKEKLLEISKKLGIIIPAGLLLFGVSNTFATENVKTLNGTNNLIKTELTIQNNEVVNYLSINTNSNKIDIDHVNNHSNSYTDRPHTDSHSDYWKNDYQTYVNKHTNQAEIDRRVDNHTNRD